MMVEITGRHHKKILGVNINYFSTSVGANQLRLDKIYLLMVLASLSIATTRILSKHNTIQDLVTCMADATSTTANIM
jgi:hypothetical protein